MNAHKQAMRRFVKRVEREQPLAPDRCGIKGGVAQCVICEPTEHLAGLGFPELPARPSPVAVKLFGERTLQEVGGGGPAAARLLAACCLARPLDQAERL